MQVLSTVVADKRIYQLDVRTDKLVSTAQYNMNVQ